MTTPHQNQYFESYLPVYDSVPEKWDDARQFLVENLKKISDSANVKEIGYFIDQEVVSGKQFIQGTEQTQEFRDVFRQVYNMSPVVAGANTKAHGITFDDNFTLVDLWVSCTDSGDKVAATFAYAEVDIDVTNINFNSPRAYDRAFAVIEYLLEE